MQWRAWDDIESATRGKYVDRWKTAVYGGENTCNCYGFNDGGGVFKTYDFDYPFHPDEGFLHKTDMIIYYARATHSNHVGTPYGDLGNPGVKAGMDIMQNVLGYHFIITRAAYRGAGPGGSARLEFDVVNEGSSPLYADWPVAFYLLDAQTRQPVWRYILPDISAGDWMPGERWNRKDAAYAVPAPNYTVAADIPVPQDIAAGNYIAAVTMLDPAGLEPAARFAMTPYINGGFTALGYINIGIDADKTPPLITGDDPQLDESLSYSLNLSLMRDVTVYGAKTNMLTDGRSDNIWAVSGSGEHELIVDLGKPAVLKSLEILFDAKAEFTVSHSIGGTDYIQCEYIPFWGRNDVGRICLDGTARFVKVVITSGDGGVAIKNINIYGEWQE